MGKVQKISVDASDYYDIIDAWATNADIKYVARVTGLTESVVRKVVKEGVPTLHLPPLPPPPKKGMKPPRTTSFKGVKPAKPDSKTLRKAAVASHTDALKHVKKAKDVLKELDNKANQLSKEAGRGEIEQEMTTVLSDLEAAALRTQVEEQRIHNIGERALVRDAVARSADEAAMARVSKSNCLNLAAVLSYTVDKLMEGIEDGTINLLPSDVNLKHLTGLTMAVERLTAAMERTIKIEKGRVGEPDKVLGIQIGLLLDGCSDEELEKIMECGQLPTRLKLSSDGGESN